MQIKLSTSDIHARRDGAGSPDYTRVARILMKEVTNTGFHRIKSTFKKAVRDFFDRTGCYKEELETFLTLNCNNGLSYLPFYAAHSEYINK